MNKKNIIILTIAILIFIGALVLFLYANSLGTKKQTDENTNTVNTTVEEANNSTDSYFYDIDGNKLTFDNFSDKPLVVFLWKSDDAKSYTIINLITKYYEEYKDKIYFLSINVNEPDIDLELIDNVKAANFSIPMYFDTDLTLYNKFAYTKLPDILFLNTDGNIEKEVSEEIDEDSFVANLDLLVQNY